MINSAVGSERLSRPQLTALRLILARQRAISLYHRLASQPSRAAHLIHLHRAELPTQLRAHV